jgi:acyl-CoA thioesterase FadM
MAVEQRLERVYRVRFDEAGANGSLRSSGYLRFAQDLAWIHSESAGFGRDWYGERGLTWLVRGVELDILDDVEYGSELAVSTQVVGFRRVVARRKTEFHRRDSERPVAVAITDWVLLNSAGRPVRPPSEILDVFTGTSDEFTALRVRLDEPPPSAKHVEFAVRLSETDPMAHVNNAAYVDYVDELYASASGRDALPLPRRYKAEFVGSAVPADRLTATCWTAGVAWDYLLEDATGREVLRAAVETDPATWVGG